MGLRRPAGPHRIATILRNEGWDVEVLDFANAWKLEELQELARSRITDKTLFIGFSIMFDMWSCSVMEDFSKWLKTAYPNIKQVIGGQWPPIHNTSQIDYFITGYGETAILELCKSLTGNGNRLFFDPKYFGTGKKVITANTSYPSFPMKSLMIKYEDRDFIQPSEWLTIEISRGCKFSCPYCTYPILGVKGDYSRDADDFRLQLQDAYDRFGVTNYFAADETFNDRSEKIVKFADAVEGLPFKPWFSGFIRADLLVSRPQDWEHIARLGFLGQFYGVETFNHESAKVIKKGMHPDRLKAGLLEARQYFKNTDRKLYRGLIALVLGLPHETKDTIASGFEWLENNWQGEAVTVTGLEIPIDATKDVLSQWSLDWKDYGYEDLDEPLVDRNSLSNYKSYLTQNVMNSRLNWSNGHMTYSEAVNIANDWVTKVDSAAMFGASPYALDHYMFYDMSLEQVLQERTEVTTKQKYDNHMLRQQVSIDAYIQKKLNM
jgi:hypothetical protein